MILPYQTLRKVISGEDPLVVADTPIQEKQIQPASLDCRVGGRVYHTNVVEPKPGETVPDLLKRHVLYEFLLDKEVVLGPKAWYVIPLQEQFRLPQGFFAVFSPKSSTGRNDVFVRVICDKNPRYDMFPSGYHGRAYLVLFSHSFAIGVAPGLELTQCRIKTADSHLSDEELKIAHASFGIVYSNRGGVIEPVIQNSSLYFHVDLVERETVGFEARENPANRIDLYREGYYDRDEFWFPIKRPQNGELVLARERFYLLTSKERVRIPPPYAAEIVTYDASFGEFRTHYAGFFDNGFGGKTGTNVVLEVRTGATPVRLYDGKPICRMMFEKTMEIPKKLYGKKAGSHYTGSGPSLSKHFKSRMW